MTPRGQRERGRSAVAMGQADRLVDVHVWIRAGSLVQLDEIATARGVSRSEALREAVTWLVAREARWMLERRQVAVQRAQRQAEWDAILEERDRDRLTGL